MLEIQLHGIKLRNDEHRKDPYRNGKKYMHTAIDGKKVVHGTSNLDATFSEFIFIL